MDTKQVVATASPVFGSAGSAWYFTEATTAAGKEIGLDPGRLYMLGRGGVLGTDDWRVVQSAFGYFNPSMLRHLWTTGLERVTREQGVEAYRRASIAWGEQALAGLEGTEAFNAAAEQLVEAAAVDAGALVLFAGYAGQPLTESPAGRAAQLIVCLRELRGSVHLTQVAAVGLATPVAFLIRDPQMLASHGWKEGDIPEPSDTQRSEWQRAEDGTTRVMEHLYSALSADQQQAIADFAVAVKSRL